MPFPFQTRCLDFLFSIASPLPLPEPPAPSKQTGSQVTPNGGIPSQFKLNEQQLNAIKTNPYSSDSLKIQKEHPREYFKIIKGM